MEAPTNYLRKDDILLDMEHNKPFRWANLDYGVVAVALGTGGGSSIIGNGLLRTVELLCIGGCSLYSEETRVMIISAFGLAGTVGAFAYTIFKDYQNDTKEKKALKLIKNSSDIIAKSDYEELIKILGPNISPDLHIRFSVPTDSQIVAISKQESKNLATLLQQILYISDPVAIYKDNVSKIYQFAKANMIEDLTQACTKYYKKNAAVINLENSIKKS